MNINDIFRREIGREIKEVIKVDDEGSVLEEIEEYVPTDHIKQELTEALEKYQETIQNPSEEINIWISGFFGSGKSSFAKVFGYLLANPSVGSTTVCERFFNLNDLAAAQSLLNTIHELGPTESVLLDLNTTPNALDEGEPIVLPVYRTLLDRFGYSSDITLAELEIDLESRSELEAFENKYEEVFGASWKSQRDVITAKNKASRVLHEIDEETYPSADSFSNAAAPPAVSAKWFTERALKLLATRRPEKKRLVLIVDEVGQYVSRSTDRMRHLQGLAEECQKTEGALWLVATSQEKLTDVVDSLEGKQTELAKAQDRFPIRVDLLPSDIDEVTGKRVLDKTADGASQIRDELDAHRNKLAASVTLQSERHQPFSDEDFVRLYPLVPYQLNVLIDAVSARRAQGGAPQTMGGSNRTLIRHAQQLVSNEFVGLKDDDIGALVTLDRSYTLLEDIIPTAWRHEVDQVAAGHGDQSLEAKVMRVIALCAEVPGVQLNTRNIAAMLHPSMSSDPIEADVAAALKMLVAEDRVRESDGGYLLQSPEQKDWEKTRRSIDMKPGDAVRLRKAIFRDAIGSMTVKAGRTFKVQLLVERESLSDGDIALDIREQTDLDSLRTTSRSEEARNRIFWAYSPNDETWEAFKELHRSEEMIDRYDNASQSDAQRVLLAEERKRLDRSRKAAEQLLSRDLTSGTIIFDGGAENAQSGEMRACADRVVSGLLKKIYPNLDLFAGSFKKADVLQILQADSLEGLPESVGPDGLGLFRITGKGRELVDDSGPIDAVVSYIEARKQYGDDQTGAQLDRHFGAPPFGAPIEALQAVLAAAMRAGLLEVVSQAARITSARDARLEQVFGNLPKFKAASFLPSSGDGDVPLETRAEVSEWIHQFTGTAVSLDLADLANASRNAFAEQRQPCVEARAALAGAGLVVPPVMDTMAELLARLDGDDKTVVETIHAHRADLSNCRTTVQSIAELVENELSTLRSATAAIHTAGRLRDKDITKSAEKLDELLAKADYIADLAQIKSVTTAIEDAAAAVVNDLEAKLTEAVNAAESGLRSRYPMVKGDDFDRVIAPLLAL